MSQDESQWKQKYLASLDRYERKEKDWKALEELLTLAMARVAIAAEGVDETLDQQLKSLRKVIHSQNYTGLEAIVEDISGCVKRLDEQRRGQAQSKGPAAVLMDLLESLSLPKQAKSRVKALQRQLHQNPTASIDTALRELAAIINDTLHAEAAPTDKRGFLERLFVPAADASALALASRNLQQVLQHISAQLPDASQLQQQLADVQDEATLQAASAALAHAIAALLTSDSAAGGASATVQIAASPAFVRTSADGKVGHTLEVPEFAGFCLRLLQTLQLPPEFEPRAQQIRERLALAMDINQSAAMLNDIADLIGATRARMEKERRDLQEFLQQLTVRLKDIDLHLAGAESHTHASLNSRKTLGAAVEAHMKGIESSVQDAADLTQLKQRVQQRLEAIRNHVLQYQQNEEQSYRNLLDKLAQSNARLHDLEIETEQLRARLNQEHAQAIQDTLTGIYNRLAYEERVEQEYQRWKRYQKPLVFLVFDVDHFKAINDSYGHKAGDKALRLIAQTLQKNLRETDFLARYGGEEFVVLMPETGIADAMNVANKLREAIAAVKFNYQERAIDITISCGAAQFKRGDSVESVFQRADHALYQAKENGRNRCHTDDA